MSECLGIMSIPPSASIVSWDHAPGSPGKYMTTNYQYFCIKNKYF